MVVMIMEKVRSSPLAFLFPWLSPLVIKFVIVNGGIEIRLYKNNRWLQKWQASMLGRVLPALLTKWIDDHHMSRGPQPYPLVKQLWQKLAPLASKKIIVDSSILAGLEEVSQPQDFAMVWVLNRSLERIEGRYEGSDRYLGMGWFQKGKKIWPLNNHPANAPFSVFENLMVPLQQVDYLLNSTIPYLQHRLPARADFQLITNFALQVIVPDIQGRGLALALQCNYPHLLSTIQVPQQKVDVLLANRAVIQFPHQALTSVLIQLLQNGSFITIQGTDIPLFISEQLPIMHHYRQISDDMVANIIQSNPIVSIATLQPTLSFIHTYENGIGKYSTTAVYHYQQYPLDMDVLLAARQQNQRFVQQHVVWFEWPADSDDLFNALQEQQTNKDLLPEEVMGFDTRRVALFHKQPPVPTMQLNGITPAERAQYLFEQLRQHGIPGGIVGEPRGLVTMFLNACENLVRDNRQARILWLVPSNKKGFVTRSINGSTISSSVTVASLATLSNEATLLARTWTLVIFQELNQWVDGGAQSRMLSQLQWHWALISITSERALSRLIMPVLHLRERYYKQFCARYLFDLERNYSGVLVGSGVFGLNTIQSASPILPQTDDIAPLFSVPSPSSAIRTPRFTTPLPSETRPQPYVQTNPNIPARSVPDNARSKPPSSPMSRTIDLNLRTIAQLHQESGQLQNRLAIEGREEQESPIMSMSGPLSISGTVRKVTVPPPKGGENWQMILQHWRPEHWEIIILLYQQQYEQLPIVESKVRRPLSRLIDEINSPVDELLGDLLIDPDTRTISNHLRATTETLVRWNLSSKRQVN